MRRLYVSYLRWLGVKIGAGCFISLGAKIDVRRGEVFIGNNCTVTHGCVILSHDATAARLDPFDDGSGITIIEDNVFIGVNSIVLRNVTVGHNTVIGAGSVVTANIPPYVVAAGSPAVVLRKIAKKRG